MFVAAPLPSSSSGQVETVALAWVSRLTSARDRRELAQLLLQGVRSWPGVERAELAEQVEVAADAVLPNPEGCQCWEMRSEYGEQSLLRVWAAADVPDTMDFIGHLVRAYQHVLRLIDGAERDPMTGLFNRKSFDETFWRLSTHCLQTTRPVVLDGQAVAQPERRHEVPPSGYWLGVLDVDHFKRVNDEHGHLIGDEVLILLARLMRQVFRRQDRFYRFGGEEFVVLLPSTDATVAESLFQRLRQAVEGHQFPQVGRITVSLGYTQIRPNDTPSAAFDRADRAVYLAKKSGRNRVVCHDTEPSLSSAPALPQSGGVELF